MDSREQPVQCQNCLEFVSSSLTNCRYCGAVLGDENATSAEDAQSNIAHACRDGKFLKLMSRALAVCFIALTFSIFSKLALAGFLILLVAMPILLIRWWIKYRSLQTEDQDYQEAKRETIMLAVIWCGTVFVWLAASAIQSFLMTQR